MVALTTEGALLLGTLGVLCEYCGHSAQLMWMLGLCVPQSCSSVVGVRNREVQFGSGADVLQSTAICIGHHIAALAYAHLCQPQELPSNKLWPMLRHGGEASQHANH